MPINFHDIILPDASFPNGGSESIWLEKIINSHDIKEKIAYINQESLTTYPLCIVLKTAASDNGYKKGAHFISHQSGVHEETAKVLAQHYKNIYPEPNLVSYLRIKAPLIKLTPYITVILGYRNNPQDEIWITKNTENISHTFSTALENYFLKGCK